ncbi:MAG: class I SAM-dependent methyltransferase [Acidobacteria bacterium]|nr:class I SAM-dependent methyltransferase [Acidobacteriota bacterium]
MDKGSTRVRRRTTCRLCSSSDLALAFSLAPTPPANAFVTADHLNEIQEVFPLDVFFCGACTHLQLLDVVDPGVLFERYVYVSGTSAAFVQHFEKMSDELADLAGPLAGRLIVDIGSNDGTLLRAFQRRHQARTLGIDPARNLAAEATASGVETIASFFSTDLARNIVEERGHAAVIAANNVFAHIDDLAEVAEGVKALLAPDGFFAFEVSYLLDVVEKTLFDTIYHEHLDYHAVRPLIPFLQSHGLELVEAIRVPTHGGSLRGIARHKGVSSREGNSVSNALSLELQWELQRLSTYTGMAARIARLGDELRSLLERLRSQGKTIAGFGAPAKATTLMYHFRIDRDCIDFIVDDNPLKQNTYSPGLHVPIVAASMLEERRPDYLLILAWNFADAIIEKTKRFAELGGKYIVPLPTVRVL